jgi:hypothetical protein
LEKSTAELASVVGTASVVGVSPALVVGASTVVGVAAATVVGAEVLAVFLSLPQAAATSESEMMPAMTSRRLTEFTYVSPWFGMNNGVTLNIEVDMQVVPR